MQFQKKKEKKPPPPPKKKQKKKPIALPKQCIYLVTTTSPCLAGVVSWHSCIARKR